MLRGGATVWLENPGYPARIWTRYNRAILDFHRRHAINRALLAAMRTLRRESREQPAAILQQQRAAQEQIGAETARMREELTGLSAEVCALHERLGATSPVIPPEMPSTDRHG